MVELSTEWLTIEQSSKVLGVCEPSVRTLVRANKLTSRKLPGVGWTRISRASIDALLSESTNFKSA
jgi:excisionase family DNA binding protein